MRYCELDSSAMAMRVEALREAAEAEPNTPEMLKKEVLVAAIAYRSYYCVSKRARDLRMLFKTWDVLLDRAALRVSRGQTPDHPFWYGERTNIGWIALAAHELRWLPIHEPSITRKRRERHRGKIRIKRISGRSDLWLMRRRRDKTIFYDCEAKEKDLSLTPLIARPDDYSLPKLIPKQLRQACTDLRNKHSDIKGDVGIAMTFLRLYLPITVSNADQQAALQGLKSHAKNGFGLSNCHFVALHLARSEFIRTVAKAYKDPYLDLGLAVLGSKLTL